MFTGAVGGTEYRARQLLSWDDMESLYCCASGPCGSAGIAGNGARPAWAWEEANRVGGFEPWQVRSRLNPGDSIPVWLRQFYRGVQVINLPGWDSASEPGSEAAPMTTAQRLASVFPLLSHLWGPVTSALSAQGSPATISGDGDGRSHRRDLGGPAGPPSRKGLSGLRFTLDPALLLPASEFSDNEAYWQLQTPRGVANISNCAAAQPLYLTKPLFLGGNASLRSRVAGVPRPMPILHDTWYDIEPETGSALTVRERMQVNALITPTWESNGRSAGPAAAPAPLYLPLLWYDKHGQIDDGGAAAFRSSTVDRRSEASALLLATVVICSVIGAFGAVLLVVGIRRGRRAQLEAMEAGIGRLLVDSSAESQTQKALLEAYREAATGYDVGDVMAPAAAVAAATSGRMVAVDTGRRDAVATTLGDGQQQRSGLSIRRPVESTQPLQYARPSDPTVAAARAPSVPLQRQLQVPAEVGSIVDAAATPELQLRVPAPHSSATSLGSQRGVPVTAVGAAAFGDLLGLGSDAASERTGASSPTRTGRGSSSGGDTSDRRHRDASVRNGSATGVAVGMSAPPAAQAWPAAWDGAQLPAYMARLLRQREG